AHALSGASRLAVGGGAGAGWRRLAGLWRSGLGRAGHCRMVRPPFVRALLVAWLAVPAGCDRGEGGLPGAEAGSMAREQEASSLGAAGSRAESPSRQHEATSPIADP